MKESRSRSRSGDSSSSRSSRGRHGMIAIRTLNKRERKNAVIQG